MELRPRKETPGKPSTRIPTSRYIRRTPRSMSSTAMTAAEITALINTAIAAHEATLTAAGRLAPVAGPAGGTSTPVLCQYVTDPYKGDFNPAEKGGAILLTKQQKL